MNVVTLRHTAEYLTAKTQYMELRNIFKFSLLNDKQNSDVYTMVMEGREQVAACVLGRIGNGNKTHKLNVRYVVLHNAKDNTEVAVITSAFSHCGSQRWTSGFYRSQLSVIALLTEKNRNQVTCERC